MMEKVENRNCKHWACTSKPSLNKPYSYNWKYIESGFISKCDTKFYAS